MPLPEIFTADASEERLAGYFEELYDYLQEEGVPEDRLPNPWHMLSRVVRCIDAELLREWLDAYCAVEADPDLSILDTPEEDRPTTRSTKRGPRPPYLRMLDLRADGDGDPDEELPDDGTGPRGTTP